ncbi:PfkB family carbohydrate kinase [Microbacterium sp. YY-01]|uniref:PfkB family carbohydrate kinase n=1 Tax=Microbacterium sp. YY-01 TaxID=3421634 RepID=UPI003D16A9AA
MSAASVCVVGSLNVDRYIGLFRLPEPGETVLGAGMGTYPGGKGLNQAVAAARCGAATRMGGAIGDDADGQLLRATLHEVHVDPTHIATDSSAPSGIAQILSLDGGENSIIVVPGANAQLTPQQAAAAVADAGVVLVQLEISIEAASAALAAGRAAGAVTVLNAAPAHDDALRMLDDVDILIVNDSELAALGGINALRSRASVVHTRGGDGLTVYPQDAEPFEVAAFAIDVVDTTGAGDAFCGGFVAALARGESLESAARHGAAAGAIVASHRGAQTPELTVSAVDALVRA